MTIYSLRQWENQTNPHYPGRPVYWTVLNHKTNISTSFNFKIDAVVYKNTLPQATVYFHWYEREFSKCSINIDPIQSYAELCRQRAQELRDTYKYLRFWFSGGTDSQTALDSFVNNNIFIDEIVVSTLPDQNAHVTSNREIALAALPSLKRVITQLPNTKITILHQTEQDITDWFNGSDDPASISAFDSTNGAVQFAMQGSWWISKMLNQTEHEDWCDIVGGSKVRLFKNKNKWYFYFPDNGLNDSFYSSRTEDFFISLGIPDLYLKTVYMLRNYHVDRGSSNNVVNNFHSAAPEWLPFSREYNTAMGRVPVHEVATYKLYGSTHNPDDWESKSISGWNSLYFYHNVITTAQGQKWYNNYKNTMQSMIQRYPDYWNVDAAGNPAPTLGPKGHVSKFYCLNDGLAYDSAVVGY